MDWTAIVIGLLVAIPPTLVGVATLIQQIKTHATFNSKMDAMLELTRHAAYAEGKQDQRDKNRKERNES